MTTQITLSNKNDYYNYTSAAGNTNAGHSTCTRRCTCGRSCTNYCFLASSLVAPLFIHAGTRFLTNTFRSLASAAASAVLQLLSTCPHSQRPALVQNPVLHSRYYYFIPHSCNSCRRLCTSPWNHSSHIPLNRLSSHS